MVAQISREMKFQKWNEISFYQNKFQKINKITKTQNINTV